MDGRRWRVLRKRTTDVRLSADMEPANTASLQYPQPRNLFPAGYGRNTSAFEMPMDFGATVEFEVGADGSVYGMGVRWSDFPERSKGSVEERAQVWFRRVDA
jgi:hypothetical protein